MLVDKLIKFIFRTPADLVVFLGTTKQPGTLIAVLNSTSIWKRESFKKKFSSLIRLRWDPSDELLQKAAKETLMNSIFGSANDFGNELYKINVWHHSRTWNFSFLTKEDNKKVDALNATTGLIRSKHEGTTSHYLSLNLFERAEHICYLILPMVEKLPVISIQHYLDLHSPFAFNAIRKAKHSNADDLISYIYEVQFIQQKVALSLHEFIHLVDDSWKNKKEALLTGTELNAIMHAETIISYLKSSIEKIIVIVGLMYGLKDLESKKTHKAKLDALDKVIPPTVKQLFYYELIKEFVSTENLTDLNNYRTGIFHKKGISDLQPHKYVNEKAQDVPLIKIFEFMREQHSKNTAVLICVYALLTDELVKLDPPSIQIGELTNILFPISKDT